MTDIYSSGAIYDQMTGPYADDIPFYVAEARRTNTQPVLELACGTGRLLIPIAEAGVPIWGVDREPNMLAQARAKIDGLPADVAARITLQSGDMREFELGLRFGLVMIPFRSFLHLLTVEDQLAALDTIRRHLVPQGRLALNFFQPSLTIIGAQQGPAGGAPQLFREWSDGENGNRVVCWEQRVYDTASQIVRVMRILDTVDPAGKVIERSYQPFSLRWIYRFEFEHLLARTGFEVEALYGDFGRSPVDRNSRELIWIARRGAK